MSKYIRQLSSQANSTTDTNISTLLFKKYQVRSIIGEGSFGETYLGLNIQTNENVALKFEKKSSIEKFLEAESYILCLLKGQEGIPEILSYGYSDKYNILIMELLGKTGDQLFSLNNKEFTLHTICLIAGQILQRLEYIHSKYIIHRDIKPENFMTGIEENKNVIYCIDYGGATRYRSSESGKHIEYFNTKKLTGTARYASRHALKGYTQSRRDDLESFAYMIIYFGHGRLPWQGLKIRKNSIHGRYYKIYDMKKNIKSTELIGNCNPIEFVDLLDYIKNGSFEENPDYKYLTRLIKNVLFKTLNITNVDYMNFDWNFSEEENVIKKKKGVPKKRKTEEGNEKTEETIVENPCDDKQFSLLNHKYAYSSPIVKQYHPSELLETNRKLNNVDTFNDNNENCLNSSRRVNENYDMVNNVNSREKKINLQNKKPYLDAKINLGLTKAVISKVYGNDKINVSKENAKVEKEKACIVI